MTRCWPATGLCCNKGLRTRLGTITTRDWLRAHDRGYSALRRATRAALVMPAMLALTDQVIGNPVMATFAAFGSFAMLLLVDFTGSIRDRLQAQAALVVTCCGLIAIGTLASRSAWLAAAVTVPVAFGLLFAGVVSSTLAGATTSLLLSFVLPVSLPGTLSSIPDRLAGWGLAGGASLIAIAVLWPAPVRDPVRGSAIEACRALAARLMADVAFMTTRFSAESEAAHRDAVARSEEAVSALRTMFFATPYRPTGLSTSARALVRLVDELQWLNGLVLRATPKHRPQVADQNVCAVKTQAASTLSAAAHLLDQPSGSPQPLRDALAAMHTALDGLEEATTARVPDANGSGGDGAPAGNGDPAGNGRSASAVITALDPSFRAQELSFVVTQIATNVDYAVAADRRSWLDRLLGRQPRGLPGLLAAAQERAGAHVERHSTWLHNSLRGAAGLALAVLAADLLSVQHGFWVVFGTLSVLRSNALSTGQTIVRALVGTAAGFAVGALIVTVIGTNTAVLWALLPFVVLVAGLAPATISFAAGQASFTLTLLILFNLLAPVGWRIGIVRIEDVAIGCAVSLAVGLLLWPRGAGVALGKALSEAYLNSVGYLASAISYGVGRCDGLSEPPVAPRTEALRSAAASRRLDDTFRGYLSERGAKPIPLAEITSLLTGVAGVRLAADAVLELWEDCDQAGGDRAAARHELLAGAAAMTGWFDRFATSLSGGGPVPDPMEPDGLSGDRLVQAVGRDLGNGAGAASATGVRVIWTGDHLDAVRRLQAMLVSPARAAVEEHALA